MNPVHDILNKDRPEMPVFKLVWHEEWAKILVLKIVSYYKKMIFIDLILFELVKFAVNNKRKC